MNLICGINPVLEALQAQTRHFDRLLIVKGLRSKRLSEAMRRATRLAVPLRFEMRETLDRMAGGVAHQGIIAVVSEKPLLSLEGLLDSAREPALVVVLDGVEDPRNLGAILRTAEAAGACGVLLPERHSAGLSETVGRASAGALEHVKVARVGNLVQALGALKQRGIWVVGFDAAGSERWDKVDLTRPVALVLGGEGRGIRRLVREHCDHLASIPHFGHIGSLNVSVAAGVALYEAVRQRGLVPSGVRPIPARPHAGHQITGPAPGDAETDPGARTVPAALDEPGENGALADEAAVRHVDLHDDVAWGQGPVILKPVGFDRPQRGDDRRRKGRRHRPHGHERRVPHEAPPAAPSGPGGPAGAGDEARADFRGDLGPRRRRRRRRGRGAGAPGGAPGSAAGGAAPHPPSTHAGEGAPPADSTGEHGAFGHDQGAGGPRPGGGRRRRRRRRR
jgi:23S rRNA (guanosine2251-2'-O)-methyltransferase